MNTRSGNIGFVLGVGGVSFVIGGIALLMLAVVRLESGGGNRPIPVPPDTAVPIPEPGFFGGSMVLYGVAGDARPDLSDLGCVLSGPWGSDKNRRLNTLGALGAGRRTVSGTALTPLATVRLRDDSTLSCSGPAARSGQPFYLLEERRRAVPRPLAMVFGLQCLVMGVSALALLRHRRRRDDGSLRPG